MANNISAGLNRRMAEQRANEALPLTSPPSIVVRGNPILFQVIYCPAAAASRTGSHSIVPRSAGDESSFTGMSGTTTT